MEGRASALREWDWRARDTSRTSFTVADTRVSAACRLPSRLCPTDMHTFSAISDATFLDISFSLRLSRMGSRSALDNEELPTTLFIMDPSHERDLPAAGVAATSLPSRPSTKSTSSSLLSSSDAESCVPAVTCFKTRHRKRFRRRARANEQHYWHNCHSWTRIQGNVG